MLHSNLTNRMDQKANFGQGTVEPEDFVLYALCNKTTLDGAEQEELCRNKLL